MFASAMTLAGRNDGDDASTGTSYVEMAPVLADHGARTNDDLRELCSRIVFNVLVSNTDDHSRNHGFILVPDKGWRLSAVFDMNSVADSCGLTLNISETDNSLDLDSVRSVAPFFRLTAEAADEIVEIRQAVVKQWRKIALNRHTVGAPSHQRCPAICPLATGPAARSFAGCSWAGGWR